mgnify:CR=1 FL=1
MKKNKKVEIFDDIECDVLQVKLTPESDREASEFIKAYKEKMAAATEPPTYSSRIQTWRSPGKRTKPWKVFG